MSQMATIPTVIRGTPTNADQINGVINAVASNYDNIFNIQTEAFTGNQYAPQPINGQLSFEFKWENDKQILKRIMAEECYISLGDKHNDQIDVISPDTIKIEATQWERSELAAKLGNSFTGAVDFCVYKDKDGEYGYAIPRVEEQDLIDNIEKLWLHSKIFIQYGGDDEENVYVQADNQYYMFTGEGESKGEPYGVFRWEGNTGTTGEGAQKQATGTISQCNFIFGRQPIHIDDFDGITDGTYWLAVPHDNPAEATIDQLGGQSSMDQTILPLFTIQNQKVTVDWRGAFTIPVWEHVAQ